MIQRLSPGHEDVLKKPHWLTSNVCSVLSVLLFNCQYRRLQRLRRLLTAFQRPEYEASPWTSISRWKSCVRRICGFSMTPRWMCWISDSKSARHQLNAMIYPLTIRRPPTTYSSSRATIYVKIYKSFHTNDTPWWDLSEKLASQSTIVLIIINEAYYFQLTATDSYININMSDTVAYPRQTGNSECHKATSTGLHLFIGNSNGTCSATSWRSSTSDPYVVTGNVRPLPGLIDEKTRRWNAGPVTQRRNRHFRIISHMKQNLSHQKQWKKKD